MIDHDTVATRAELLAEGFSRRGLAKAIAAGIIVRVRRNRYMSSGATASRQEAVRIGGRVACLSLLQMLEVFVFENSTLHVHVERGASRLRSAQNRRQRLEARPNRTQRLHWLPNIRPDDATACYVGIVDALAQSILCQLPRYAVATLDSALNKGLIDIDDLADIFAALPSRYRVLHALIDGRAQSGPETLLRLMARSLGCSFDLQVYFHGVGYVDLVIDGWLVVECDSKEFHEDWAQQKKDRDRDLALAALGYSTFRPNAAQIMYRPDEVLAALRGLTRARASFAC